MTPDDIGLLIAAMRANGVTRLEWRQTRKGTRLCLVLPESQSPPDTSRRPAAPPLAVTAPGIGVFAARGGDDGLPALADGARVRAGEALGYIAQGPVLHLLIAPADARLSGPLPEAGRVFGYGDRVVELEGCAE